MIQHTHARLSGLCLRLFPVIGVLAVAAPASSQDLWVTVQPETVSVAPGGSALFLGTIENRGSSEESLDGISIYFLGTGVSFDDTPFWTTFPVSLLGGEKADGSFMLALCEVWATPGDYQGTVQIIGGSGDSNIAPFTLRLEGAIVPEFGTITALAGMLGLGGFGLLRRRLGRRTT